MPSHFKKRVQERMQKTGESWQQAARHVRSQVSTTKEAVATTAPTPPGAGPNMNVLPSSHYDQSGLWFPLRRDGMWLIPAYWERNLRVLRSPKMGRRALAALTGVFTPTWSRNQHGTQGHHPVIYDQLTICGRYRLLEVGAMLAVMPERAKRLRERLLPADGYRGSTAELRAGLMLLTTGAQIEWEPVSDGAGPDWLARWNGGALAVEVKCPRESKRERERQTVLTEFMFEFTRSVGTTPLPVDRGVWVTLCPNDTVLAKTVLGAIDMAAVRLLARQTADIVRATLPTPLREGRFPAGPACDFTIQLGLGDEPQVQFAMRGLEQDVEYDGQRIFETVREAAEQTRKVEGVPGLIVIDADDNYMLLNQVGNVYELLHSASWATGIAGVAFVTATGTSDDQIKESRTDTIVRIVPGLQAEALTNTLLSGLRMCDQEHLHCDTLMVPARRCKVRL